MDVTVWTVVLVVAAGFLAGGLNALAGGGTLIAFPVLVAVGVPAWTANIACSVGLLPGYLGGAYAYRRELGTTRSYRGPLIGAALVGGVVGAALLLVTPKRTFELVVPFLVLASVLLLMARGPVSRFVAAHGQHSDPTARPAAALVLSILAAGAYGSYFGAGLGVVLVAVLGSFLAVGLQVQNALKSVLSLASVAAGVVVYIALGEVAWLPALLLLSSSLIGGVVGGRLGRRLPDAVLRRAIIAVGLVVSAVLFVTTYA